MPDVCEEVLYQARPGSRWWQLICLAPAGHDGPHRLMPLRDMGEIPPADWHRTLIVDPRRVVWQPAKRVEEDRECR